MSNVLKMAAVGGAVSAETDPNFKQTVLLLHGDGTNGAQNNTFLDSSSNNFTITRNPTNGPNAPTQGTFSPFSVGAGEWSNYFDGTGDYLTVGNNAAFDFGSGNFTLEAWVNIGSSSGFKSIFSKVFDFGPFILAVDGTTVKYYLSSTGSSWDIANGVSGGTVSVNSWAHVALVRNSNTVTPYVNGVAGTTTTTSATLTSNTRVLVIGADQTSSSTFVDNFNGYISNARIVKGTAVYTGAFTPPTLTPLATSGSASAAAYPSTTNVNTSFASSATSLLTCQSNRFVDNSTANSGTGFAITRNGDVRVTPFSPFAPSAAYSASTNGGSGYFDGTGDYLSLSQSALIATGDFTLEAWCFTTRSNAFQGIVSLGNAANTAGVRITQGNTGNLEFWINGQANAATALPLNQWNHVAIVRSGSATNNVSCYLNGNRVAQLTQTTSTTNSDCVIGRYYNNSTDQYHWLGYIADARMVVGSALYSGTTYTIPTAPLTAITNTSLLLNFTNAGILDNTGKNNLETVGNAQIDTTTKKYGTGSMEFDGNGDWLQIPRTVDLDFGSGDFTVELWVNPTSTSVSSFVTQSSANSNGWALGFSGVTAGRVWWYSNNAAVITSSSSLSTGVWTHVAIVRSGSTLTMYFNGSSVGSTTNTTSYVGSSIIYVGSDQFSQHFTGFIDDLRITKGVARYPTEPFPTKEFPDQ